MATNYVFGVSRALPSTTNFKTNFAPSTTAAILNRPAVAQRVPTLASTNNSQPQQSVTTQNKNTPISTFGEEVTRLTVETANKRREEKRKAEEEAQRQKQQISTFDPSQQFSGDVSNTRNYLVNQAKSMLGMNYAWGGGGYGVRASRGIGKGTQNVVGVDCSGLTSYVYSTIGVRLARQSDAQLRTAGYRTSINNLRPGDLVGWAKGGHVGMYIGNGQIIESPKPGAKVRVRTISSYDSNAGIYGVHLSLPGD